MAKTKVRKNQDYLVLKETIIKELKTVKDEKTKLLEIIKRANNKLMQLNGAILVLEKLESINKGK